MDKYILHIYTDMGERAGKGLKRTAQIKIINNNNKALSAAVNSLLTDALSAAAAAAHSLSLSLWQVNERHATQKACVCVRARERASSTCGLAFFVVFSFSAGAPPLIHTHAHTPTSDIALTHTLTHAE